jgi:hypothetical protein
LRNKKAPSLSKETGLSPTSFDVLNLIISGSSDPALCDARNVDVVHAALAYVYDGPNAGGRPHI